MSLVAIGINHRTAPVDIRERVVFSPDTLVDALRDLASMPEISEAAILSTCNRTELYCNLTTEQERAVVEWLKRYHKLSGQDIEPYLYIHPEQSAVRHIFRVASGLDSMILGEPQILGQMKDAYRGASRAGTSGRLLGRLFQHTFSVAKQVRTDTAIGASAVSVAFAAVSLARQIFGDLSQQTALVIGAGETIELAVRHLHENQLGRLIVANRTVERAHKLASQFDGYAIDLTELPGHLAEADIVISSTASPVPIVGKGAVERALKARKHRPMFMVDVAVPRDIEPEVGDLSDVYLYTVDDLDEIIQENLKSRQDAAKQAEDIIDVQADQFMGWVRSLDATSLIRAYREQAEAIQREVLKKGEQMLTAGKDPAETLTHITRLLTNKLIHIPSSQLKQAGFDGRFELMEAARELFNLKDIDA